jgi:hypothetical protein
MPPYPFGKGPIAVAFETFVQETDAAFSMLKTVWNDPLGKNNAFRKTLKKPDRDHLDEVLYPEEHLPAGAPEQERNNARRDGEKRRDAVRNGIKGALILALGVDPNLAAPTRNAVTQDPPWPIEFFWGCGAATDTCWVSTRDQPNDKRQVTFILLLGTDATPGPVGQPAASAGPVPDAPDRSVFIYRRATRASSWVQPPVALGGLKATAKKVPAAKKAGKKAPAKKKAAKAPAAKKAGKKAPAKKNAARAPAVRKRPA